MFITLTGWQLLAPIYFIAVVAVGSEAPIVSVALFVNGVPAPVIETPYDPGPLGGHPVSTGRLFKAYAHLLNAGATVTAVVTDATGRTEQVTATGETARPACISA